MWKCRCGENNPDSSTICQSCGNNRLGNEVVGRTDEEKYVGTFYGQDLAYTKSGTTTALALLAGLAFIVAVVLWIMTAMDDDFIAGAIISTVVFFVFTNSLLAMEFSNVAKSKGYDDSKYFLYTFIFGLYGMLLVIALPPCGTANINKAVAGKYLKDETKYGETVSGFTSGAMNIPKRK